MVASNLTVNRSASYAMPTRHSAPEPSDAVSYDVGNTARPISPIRAIAKPVPHTTVSQIHTIPTNGSNVRQKSTERRQSNPLNPSRGHSVDRKPNPVRSGPGNVTFGENEKAGVQGNYKMQEGDKVVEMRRGESRVVSESKYLPDGQNLGTGGTGVSSPKKVNFSG